MKNTLCLKKKTLCYSCESKGYNVKEDTTVRKINGDGNCLCFSFSSLVTHTQAHERQ